MMTSAITIGICNHVGSFSISSTKGAMSIGMTKQPVVYGIAWGITLQGTRTPKWLSATFVKTVTRPGRYGDGRGRHGLSLLAKPIKLGGQSRPWSQRLRINGNPVSIGLGSFPVVSLAESTP